jgi:hypothetical protein
MRLETISLLVLLLLSSAAGGAKEKQENSHRVGDLAVTLVGIEEPEGRSDSDHHILIVRLRAENLGKQALCASFRSTLRTTFGLQYQGISSSTSPFRIREMLPDETIEGEYDFSVKKGVEPLQFFLIPISRTQLCTGGRQSFSATQPARFDLTGLSSPSSPDKADAVDESPETPKATVFFTGSKGEAPQPNAMKAFHEHCPWTSNHDRERKGQLRC